LKEKILLFTSYNSVKVPECNVSQGMILVAGQGLHSGWKWYSGWRQNPTSESDVGLKLDFVWKWKSGWSQLTSTWFSISTLGLVF